MNEPFDLPVNYKGKDLLFPSKLLQTGYSHKFEVEVYGSAIFYEPDEEGGYRAIAHPDDDPNSLDKALLQAIAEAIAEVLK